MNVQPKLYGGGESPVVEFKELWKRKDFVDSREYWRELVVSSLTREQIREEIYQKLNIKIGNRQLYRVREFIEAQDQRDLMEQMSAERQKELLAGGMTLEEAQEVLLLEAAAYCTAARDFKLGLRTSAAICRSETIKLNQERFKLSLRTKLQTALESLAEHIHDNPAAREAYEKFHATIVETTK